MRMFTALALSGFLGSQAFGATPVFKVDKNKLGLIGENTSLVYNGENSFLAVDSLKELKGKNLYVTRIPAANETEYLEQLAKISKIHIHEQGDYALVEIKGDERALAELTHHENGMCGALKLLNEFSEINLVAARPGEMLIDSDEVNQRVKNLQAQVSSNNIYTSVKFMENIGTRYHKSESGKVFPITLSEKYARLIPESRKDVSISFHDVPRSVQDNIVITIEGSEKPEEKVIIGSHIDSIVGWGRGDSAPGADDNASGTATNLEIFRVLMENGIKPKRTIEIHGYAAEEVGLVGSQVMAGDYANQNKNVVAMVQMDMNLYSKRNDLSKMWFVNNGTNEELTKNLMKMTKNYLGVEPIAAKLTAGTSDHQSWHQRGFAAAFPFENPNEYNRKIHTVNDRADAVGNAEFSALYAKLGISYLMHYAGF